MTELGSKKDRHAVIGGGEIGEEALMRFISQDCVRNIPIYLETPLDDEGHKAEIQRVKEKLHEIYNTTLF